MKKEKDKIEHTRSSGNVFADLGLPHTEEDMLKIKIARAIATTIEQHELTQVAAAKILGTDQAKISAIVRGRLKDFSTVRLFSFLTALGHDVEISISKRTRKQPEQGQIKVYA